MEKRNVGELLIPRGSIIIDVFWTLNVFINVKPDCGDSLVVREFISPDLESDRRAPAEGDILVPRYKLRILRIFTNEFILLYLFTFCSHFARKNSVYPVLRC